MQRLIDCPPTGRHSFFVTFIAHPAKYPIGLPSRVEMSGKQPCLPLTGRQKMADAVQP